MKTKLLGMILSCSWTEPKDNRIAVYSTDKGETREEEFLIEQNEIEEVLKRHMHEEVEITGSIVESFETTFSLERKQLLVEDYKLV